MANLRHMGTGKELVKQVLHKAGSKTPGTTKQATVPVKSPKNKLPSPTKFNKGV